VECCKYCQAGYCGGPVRWVGERKHGICANFPARELGECWITVPLSYSRSKYSLRYSTVSCF